MENEERGETSVSRRLFSLTLKYVNADRGCVLELLKCFEKESPSAPKWMWWKQFRLRNKTKSLVLGKHCNASPDGSMNLSCPQRTMNDNRKQYSMRRMNHKSWTMAYQYFNGVPRACIHCIPAHLRIGFKVYAGDLF